MEHFGRDARRCGHHATVLHGLIWAVMQNCQEPALGYPWWELQRVTIWTRFGLRWRWVAPKGAGGMVESGNLLSHEVKPMAGGCLVYSRDEGLTHHARDMPSTLESRRKTPRGQRCHREFMRAVVLKGPFKKMLFLEMLSSLRAVSEG